MRLGARNRREAWAEGLVAGVDWARTAAGPEERWPQSLRTALDICFDSRFPIIIFWGRELVQFYNEAYSAILGAKHPNAFGQRAADCFPEIWDQIEPMLSGVLETGVSTWSEDMLLRLERNGFAEECYFTFSYSPLSDDDGIGGVFCAVTETTAKVLREREARERAEALAELDRAKTDFFNNVSHEFRTPLTLILGPLDEAVANERALEVGEAELVRRNARRLLRLVNTLLEFSRIDANRVGLVRYGVDLPAFTAGVASTFRSAFESNGIALEIDTPPLDSPVSIDARLWEHLVLNLLSNALKFTLRGSVRVALRRDGELLRLEVSDEGIGMSQAEAAHAFERFWRGSGRRARTHEGSGIGLAFVAQIAELHGGSARLESVEGAGTTVVVEIPYEPAPEPAPEFEPLSPTTAAELILAETDAWRGSPAPTDGGVAEPDRPRILLVEDNADLRDYIASLLEPAYCVVLAADGTAGLEAALAATPDLVLSDVMMPGVDGIELVRRLRAEPALQSVPIVLLSARADDRATDAGLAAGADDYLLKPFTANQLILRLERQLSRASMRERLAEARERDVRALAEAIPQMVWSATPEGRNDYYNSRWAEYIGEPWQEGGTKGFDRIHPADREQAIASWRHSLDTGDPYNVQLRMRSAAGTYRWFMVRAVAQRDEHGAVVRWFGTSTDIEELKDAQEALTQSERRYRSLIETTTEGVWVLGADALTTFVNARMAEMLGYAPSQILGRSFWDFVEPAFREEGERLKGLVLTGEQSDSDMRLLRRDGTVMWAHISASILRDEDGAVQGVLGMFHDITARKRAEEMQHLLADASGALARSLGLRQTLDALLGAVVPALATWVSIDLCDEDARNEDEPARTAAVLHAEPEKTRSARNLLGLASRREIHDVLGAGSLVEVPLTMQGRTLGSMTLASTARIFDAGDAALFAEIAARAGIAIEHARLYDRERRVAITLQDAALPKKLPSVPGLTFSAVYQAARSEALVGGDWYDAFRLGDGRIVLSIGDVIGSGLDAAVTMGAVRQAIRGAAQIYPEPVAVLNAADRALRSEQPDRIVTAFVGLLDPLTLTFTYASAGHPPAFLRSDDGTLHELGGSGLPLGLRDTDRAIEAPRTLTLSDQSLLVLYTDGLTEATRDIFEGEQRLRSALNDPNVLEAEETASAIRDAVLEQSHDDVAILAVRVDDVRSRLTRVRGGDDARAHWTFDAADAIAARSVRAQIAATLAKHGAGEADVCNAELLFSELVGNVMRHTTGPVEAAIDLTGPNPVLHVLDRGKGFTFHARLPNDVMSESGRGLYIAAALAAELSVLPRKDGGSHARAVLSFETRA